MGKASVTNMHNFINFQLSWMPTTLWDRASAVAAWATRRQRSGSMQRATAGGLSDTAATSSWHDAMRMWTTTFAFFRSSSIKCKAHGCPSRPLKFSGNTFTWNLPPTAGDCIWLGEALGANCKLGSLTWRWHRDQSGPRILQQCSIGDDRIILHQTQTAKNLHA